MCHLFYNINLYFHLTKTTFGMFSLTHSHAVSRLFDWKVILQMQFSCRKTISIFSTYTCIRVWMLLFTFICVCVKYILLNMNTQTSCLTCSYLIINNLFFQVNVSHLFRMWSRCSKEHHYLEYVNPFLHLL